MAVANPVTVVVALTSVARVDAADVWATTVPLAMLVVDGAYTPFPVRDVST